MSAPCGLQLLGIERELESAGKHMGRLAAGNRKLVVEHEERHALDTLLRRPHRHLMRRLELPRIAHIAQRFFARETETGRDVGEDLSNNGRIYLPLADFARFQYSERDLVGRVYDGRFAAMTAYQADRAAGFYQEAIDAMPKSAARALVPAEIMRSIYQPLLEKMRKDGFKVFDRRYKLSKARKMAIFSKHLLRLGSAA